MHVEIKWEFLRISYKIMFARIKRFWLSFSSAFVFTNNAPYKKVGNQVVLAEYQNEQITNFWVNMCENIYDYTENILGLLRCSFSSSLTEITGKKVETINWEFNYFYTYLFSSFIVVWSKFCNQFFTPFLM